MLLTTNLLRSLHEVESQEIGKMSKILHEVLHEDNFDLNQFFY